MHMPDYSLNVSAMVKLEQERIIACTLCLVEKHSSVLLFWVCVFLQGNKTRPLCFLQIFNIMAFHLLNLQIKWQLKLNCSVPWHGDCHHPVSAFLQRVI